MLARSHRRSVVTNSTPFASLDRSLGVAYGRAAGNSDGWAAHSVRHANADATLLLKAVPETEDELRLLRWKNEKGAFCYALEVGPRHRRHAISHAEGLVEGDAKFGRAFEAALSTVLAA